MSETYKNKFTRSESSPWDALNDDYNNSAFSVESNTDGVWRATPKYAGLAVEKPEVKVGPEEAEGLKIEDLEAEMPEEPKKPKKEKKEKIKKERKTFKFKLLPKTVGAILVGAQFATSLLLMISLISTNIIGGIFIVLLAGFLIILLALSIIKLLVQERASTPTKVACGAVSVIAIVLSIFALRYTDAFNAFLNKITERRPETKQYSVVVTEKSTVKELSGLNTKNIGFLKTDEKAGNAEQYLKSKINFEANFYDDLDTLTGVLNGDIVDAITIETDRMEMLKEEAADTIKNTRVIYTFEIEIASENAEIIEKQITKEPFVLYISGSDSRNGVKATARSDVNILAVVNPAKAKILLVSIPRDTYVQLHGTTGIKDKLTHAGVYGINMSKTTIEDFLGIKIDYTAKVSFDTVVKVVDELNGIEIDSDQAMSLGAEGKNKTCNYVVGKQMVDGDCALRFARERKSYKTGDRHRGENQMQVISAIVAKLSGSKDYVLRLPEILNIAADSFETSLTRDDISSFIRMQLNDGIKWEVESILVDGTGSMQGTYSMGAGRPLYVMIPAAESVVNATNKINEYLSV